MNEFNGLIKNRKAKMLSFPGASSRQLLHHMDIHLEEIQVDTVLIHIGVNDLLNYRNQSRIDMLMKNIICMVEKCRNYGVNKIFLTGIVFPVGTRRKMNVFCTFKIGPFFPIKKDVF